MTAEASLSTRIATAFYGHFPHLHEAQQAAIGPLLAGKNIVLSSGTGSGKTEAAVAPLVERYWQEALQEENLFLLYIAPTKALANDLEKRLEGPLRTLGLRVGIRHGDRDDLGRVVSPHVLITTPESLEVLLFRKDAALRFVRAVVIDEVHLLYNTQRGLQLSILLRRLQNGLQRPLQWAALSATIGRLENVRDFLFGPQTDADFIKASAARSIDARVIALSSHTAFQALIEKLIKRPRAKLLLFANSRRECEQLVAELQDIEGLRDGVFAHYSSLSAEVRVEIEGAFASASSAICVATSTLELGIDIGDIDAVLLWGMPASVESFLQRIGRSNRRAQKTNVICLIPPETDNVMFEACRSLALIEAGRKGEMPLRAPYALYGTVGQQCLSMIYANTVWFTRIADLCSAFAHIRYLDRPTIERILAELARQEYVLPHGFQNRYGPAQHLNRLVDYRMIYGNFGASSREVEVHYGEKKMGAIPAANLLRVGVGNIVRFAGQCWRIHKASPEGIALEPVLASLAAVDFTYGGKGVHPDVFVLDRIWRLLHADTFPLELLDTSLRTTIQLARDSLRSVCGFHQIPCRHSSEGFRYTTCAGYMVNKAVALFTNQADYTAQDTVLITASRVVWKSLPTDPQAYEAIFPQLFEPSSEQSIYQTLLPLELQRQEFLQAWLKDRTIHDVLVRLADSETVEIQQAINL